VTIQALDSDTVRQLTVADTVSWLRAKGWCTAEDESPLHVRFTRQVEEGVAEVEVPRRSDLGDFPLRMAEVVDIAASVERRPQLEIVREIRQAGVDTLWLRFDGGPAQRGRVTVENGAGLFLSVRELLLAAACATIERRALYARRKPDQAMRFLQHVSLAPPETGSFTVVVESSVIPALHAQQSLFGEDQDPPFERRAMRTLATSLEAALRAAEATSVSQELQPFVQAVNAGVSANLCEALSGLLRSVPGGMLETRFGWSRNRPLPASAPGMLRFRPDTIGILDAVAREFRTREPQPDFELRGPILELASDNPARGGMVTIGGALESRVVKVRVHVDGDVYRRALEAHEQRRAVLVEGELVRDGRSYSLRNPRGFAVEREE
jgi:hypothetical protein